MSDGLDPEIKALLDAAAAMNLPETHTLSVAEARAQMRAARAAVAGEPAPVHDVSAHTLPGPTGPIPLRVYRPSDQAGLPALVYYHGGGWVIGDLDTHDDVCQALCHHAGCVVVSVDYRLAPEHPFPAAVDDAWAACRWVAANGPELDIDSERLAVGGDSAGGNLAAVVTQLARAAAGPALRFQLLVYPATDMTLSYPSINDFATGYRLSRADMQWFVDHYMGNADYRQPTASPLFADDFAGLPPALVITAGFDPLRDEGRAYAERLTGAGVAVDYRCYDGMVHGFFGMAGAVAKAREAQRLAGEALGRALAEERQT